MSKLKDIEEFKDIKVNHDMIKLEREEGKLMYEKAKEMTNQSEGKYHYRVRGPPWKRRIVKLEN